MPSPIALIVSLQDVDQENIKTWKGDLERNLGDDEVQLHLLKDVKDLFARLNKYADKLKKALETTKLVIVFTSPNLATITDEKQLISALKELPELDESCAKMVGKFIGGERKSGGNLLLVSLEEKMELNDFFGDVTHLSGMATGNNEDISKWIAKKCR